MDINTNKSNTILNSKENTSKDDTLLKHKRILESHKDNADDTNLIKNIIKSELIQLKSITNQNTKKTIKYLINSRKLNLDLNNIVSKIIKYYNFDNNYKDLVSFDTRRTISNNQNIFYIRNKNVIKSYFKNILNNFYNTLKVYNTKILNSNNKYVNYEFDNSVSFIKIIYDFKNNESDNIEYKLNTILCIGLENGNFIITHFNKTVQFPLSTCNHFIVNTYMRYSKVINIHYIKSVDYLILAFSCGQIKIYKLLELMNIYEKIYYNKDITKIKIAIDFANLSKSNISIDSIYDLNYEGINCTFSHCFINKREHLIIGNSNGLLEFYSLPKCSFKYHYQLDDYFISCITYNYETHTIFAGDSEGNLNILETDQFKKNIIDDNSISSLSNNDKNIKSVKFLRQNKFDTNRNFSLTKEEKIVINFNEYYLGIHDNYIKFSNKNYENNDIYDIFNNNNKFYYNEDGLGDLEYFPIFNTYTSNNIFNLSNKYSHINSIKQTFINKIHIVNNNIIIIISYEINNLVVFDCFNKSVLTLIDFSNYIFNNLAVNSYLLHSKYIIIISSNLSLISVELDSYVNYCYKYQEISSNNYICSSSNTLHLKNYKFKFNCKLTELKSINETDITYIESNLFITRYDTYKKLVLLDLFDGKNIKIL